MKRVTGWLTLGWLTLGMVGVASGHAHLLQVTPADGSVVAQAPAAFSFKFSEAATLTALSLQKTGEAEQKLPLPDSPATPDIRVAAPTLSPGSYTLTYRVLSADHHIVSGHIAFKVGG
jgi:copper transport protein